MSTVQSKKNKNNHINKTELWNIFDTEIIDDKIKPSPLECLYRSSGHSFREIIYNSG